MSEKILDVHGKPVNRMAMMMVLLVGVFSVMLMQTALGTALPALMTAFNVNASTVQWLTTMDRYILPTQQQADAVVSLDSEHQIRHITIK
ncbi:hypothetical protein GQS40_12440|uniref:Uncharacterized protein n=1 Tax=Leuconostoc lactis TaxID=1246 RepID=A0A6L7A7W5_LEULA|nr:hypothetical protein [Leuconostoc lactis]